MEAQQVGFGTSGRNAGFLIDVPHDIGAPDYIGNPATARQILQLNQFGQFKLRDLAEEYQLVDAQLRHSGKYQAAIEDKSIKVLDAYRGGLEKLGEKVELIEGSELRDHIGTSFYRKALFTHGTMLPIFTYGSLTRPLAPAEQASIGGKEFWGVIPADPFGTTLRRTHDNRILVRNSFSFNADGRHKPGYTAKVRKALRLSFERRFPPLTDVEFAHGAGRCRPGGLTLARFEMTT